MKKKELKAKINRLLEEIETIRGYNTHAMNQLCIAKRTISVQLQLVDELQNKVKELQNDGHRM